MKVLFLWKPVGAKLARDAGDTVQLQDPRYRSSRASFAPTVFLHLD
jgi:hypothetical protein